MSSSISTSCSNRAAEYRRFAIRIFDDADAEPLLAPARRAIFTIGPRAYNAAQVEAWLGRHRDSGRYRERAG